MILSLSLLCLYPTFIHTHHCVYFAFIGSESCVYIICAVNNHKSSYRPIGSMYITIPFQTNHWQIAGSHCWFMFSLDFGKGRRQVQSQLDFWFFKCMVFKISFSRLLLFFMIIFCKGVNCKQKLVVCPFPWLG